MVGDRPRETGVRVGRRSPRAPARVRRGRLGWCVATVGLLAAVGCRLQLPTGPTEPYTPPTPEFITYTGSVFHPQVTGHGPIWGPSPAGIKPLPGARVTIVGGQPDGWTTLTDAEGRFAFEAYPYCELESVECAVRPFRVEKAGYETRTLGASDPYRTTSPRNLHSSASEKHIPLSHAWPADPDTQRMRRDLPAMDPLWLIVGPDLRGATGNYTSALVVVRSLAEEARSTLGHEYCHAHEDWTIDPTRYNNYGDWLQTPAGLAFLAAWEAEWPHPYLAWVEIRGSRSGVKGPAEEAAEICSHYFYDFWTPQVGTGTTVGRRYLRDHVPHMYAWAEEWLRWR